jgi:hypothetical protein
MRSPFRLLFALAAPAALLLALPSSAQAYERQWHAGGGLGYAFFAEGGNTLHGLGVGAHLTYGLSDAFNLLVQVDGSNHFGPAPFAPRVLASGSVGVGYVIDVLQWVPYVGVMAGGYGVFAPGACGAAGEPACVGARLGLSVPFGLDYQLSRSFALGVAGRYGILLFGEAGGVGQTLTMYLRAEYLWGY